MTKKGYTPSPFEKGGQRGKIELELEGIGKDTLLDYLSKKFTVKITQSKKIVITRK